jgi:hypothetical protein
MPEQPLRPHRIQLSRKSGARLPADAVSIGYPTKWANPHRPAERSQEANAAAVAAYRDHLRRHPELVDAARAELPWKRLACWCAPELLCTSPVQRDIRGCCLTDQPRRDRWSGSSRSIWSTSLSALGALEEVERDRRETVVLSDR